MHLKTRMGKVEIVAGTRGTVLEHNGTHKVRVAFGSMTKVVPRKVLKLVVATVWLPFEGSGTTLGSTASVW